jgi:hypothetical protein
MLSLGGALAVVLTGVATRPLALIVKANDGWLEDDPVTRPSLAISTT